MTTVHGPFETPRGAAWQTDDGRIHLRLARNGREHLLTRGLYEIERFPHQHLTRQAAEHLLAEYDLAAAGYGPDGEGKFLGWSWD